MCNHHASADGGVNAILTKFKSSITGYVVFDPNNDDTVSAVLTYVWTSFVQNTLCSLPFNVPIDEVEFENRSFKYTVRELAQFK